MEDTYYINVHWGGRGETAAECAARAQRFFQALRDYDPSFEHWHLVGKAPRRAINYQDLRDLEDLFWRGRVHSSRGRKVMEDMGFRLGCFTTQPDGSTDLGMRCGASTVYGRNICLMHPPTQGAVLERLVDAPVLARILAAMAEAWDPEYGVATSHAVRDLVPQRNQKETDVGWLTYISRLRGTVPPVPAPVRIERVADRGTLIILTPERMTASNPEHVALNRQVRGQLERANLLIPTQTWPPPATAGT